MSLSATIQTLLEGRTVRVAHLVEFCFRSQARRLWNGSYMIHTGGHDWFGLSKLGAGIEGLEDDGGLQANEMRFSISGVDSRLLSVAVSEDRADYIGAHVKVFYQFFGEDWQLLDDPVARAAGIIDGLEVTRQPMEPAGTRRIISLTAQNIFYGRVTPPASFFTNRDQDARFPGDRGLSYVADLIETNIPFPW